ncbi:hypothetical protein GE061_000456 [Apolygus lucorum]|uniref:protein-serine/threonine phosphatase n=1 Tax=Apolygus lucorum TaxID=248454 RepID=A0A6A4KDI4_APOLU|nr:hypothetical protein GE061_000456 [Apolygus lucorum]
MEDAHTVLLSVPEDPDAAFFGVFDGHGGASIAEYASKHLSRHIFMQEHYSKGDIIEAIRRGYLELDATMRENELLRAELAGSTAVTVLLKDNKVYCGNAGDSRAIAMVGGHVRALSQDHKPTNKIEHDRIKEAGGFVDMNRVNGNLALSRALGDYNFKTSVRKSAENQIVTANPDVTVFETSSEWQFIVLACDGIWDVLTNEEVGSFVAERLANNIEPHLICEQLMDRCLAPDGLMGGLGLDNMTIKLISIKGIHSHPIKQDFANLQLETVGMKELSLCK